MSILKNEIPILEFDAEQNAVIDSTHENLDIKLPPKCVFAFLGEYIEEYASKNDVGRILRTFKIKKNVEVTDNGKIII